MLGWPLILIVPLWLIAGWIIIDETYFYDVSRGVDNAPRRSAVLLSAFLLLLYFIYVTAVAGIWIIHVTFLAMKRRHLKKGKKL